MRGDMGTSNYIEADVAFTLEPSRRLVAFIVLAAAGTASLLAAMPLPAGASVAAAAWCALAFVHALGRHTRRRSVHILAGRAIVVDGLAGEIVAGSFVAPWLTIVHWRAASPRLVRTVVVLPDMLDAATFRRLRVILRWAPPG
jgi:toxin CptA